MLDKKLIFQNFTLFKLDVGKYVMFVKVYMLFKWTNNYIAAIVFHLLL